MAVLVLKVLPQREAAIKGEISRSPSEGGVTGASGTEGVVEEHERWSHEVSTGAARADTAR